MMPQANVSHDAAAVRRIMTRIEQRKAEIAELERNLTPHANRLSGQHGYCVPLRGEALRRLAFAS